jgi:hypothetical protein
METLPQKCPESVSVAQAPEMGDGFSHRLVPGAAGLHIEFGFGPLFE